MPYVVATRVKTKSWFHALLFVFVSTPPFLQACLSRGMLRGSTLWTRELEALTVTVWADAKAMKAFRDSGPHAAVQTRWATFGHASSFVMWRSEDDQRPSWPEVQQRLADRGFWPDSPVRSGAELRELHPVGRAGGLLEIPLLPLRRRVR